LETVHQPTDCQLEAINSKSIFDGLGSFESEASGHLGLKVDVRYRFVACLKPRLYILVILESCEIIQLCFSPLNVREATTESVESISAVGDGLDFMPDFDFLGGVESDDLPRKRVFDLLWHHWRRAESRS
jgi:hypothetical protein